MPKLKELGKLQGVTISFTKEQYTGLLHLVRTQDRSIAYLVRDAVSEYLKQRATALAAEGEPQKEGATA